MPASFPWDKNCLIGYLDKRFDYLDATGTSGKKTRLNNGRTVKRGRRVSATALASAVMALLSGTLAVIAVLQAFETSDLNFRISRLETELAEQAARTEELARANETLARQARDAADQMTRVRAMEKVLKRYLGTKSGSSRTGGRNQGGPEPVDPETLRLMKDSLFNRLMNRPEGEPRPVEEELSEILAAMKEQRASLAGIPSIMPSADPSAYISGPFGQRTDPVTGSRDEFHYGLDIAGVYGSPVVAPADGRVFFSGNDGGGGETVKIAHAPGIITAFGHLSKRIAREGSFVRRGDAIGLMGQTGRSTGTHLHYSVIVDGEYVDPAPFLWDGMANPLAGR